MKRITFDLQDCLVTRSYVSLLKLLEMDYNWIISDETFGFEKIVCYCVIFVTLTKLIRVIIH